MATINPREAQASSRERLLAATEQILARDGLRGARVNEITRLAGQRNTSALHYHFGSLQGAVDEIIRHHQVAIERDRAAILAALPPKAPVRSAVAAVVQPLAGQLVTASGRNYLRIVPEVVAASGWEDTLRSAPEGLVRCFDMVSAQLRRLPPEILAERIRAMMLTVTTLLAMRAALVERQAPDLLDGSTFSSNLTEMATAMLNAPHRG